MDAEREWAIRDRAAEYEYLILDGAAVAPEGRLAELDRLLAADVPDLLTALDAARAVLAALVETPPIERFGAGHYECHYCSHESALWAIRRDEVEHADTCPWLQAKALLATPPAASGEAAGVREGGEG